MGKKGERIPAEGVGSFFVQLRQGLDRGFLLPSQMLISGWLITTRVI